MRGILIHFGICFLQGLCHCCDTRHILCPRAFAALLGAALDQVGNQNALLRIEDSNALRAVEFMGGCRKHIDIVIHYIHWYMSDCLNSICMEKDILLPADGPDLPDGLDRANLIICKHNCYQASVLANGVRNLLRKNEAVLMNVQQCNLEALFFQLF